MNSRGEIRGFCCQWAVRLKTARGSVRLRGGFGGQDPDTGSGDLAVAVHPEIVRDAGAGHEVGSLALMQARDVEEDILAAGIGAKESEALVFEIGHDRAGLNSGRIVFGAIAGGHGCARGPAGFVSYA